MQGVAKVRKNRMKVNVATEDLEDGAKGSSLDHRHLEGMARSSSGEERKCWERKVFPGLELF